MAMDGSFSLESAVKRFLARCPVLGSIRELDHLVKKGHMVTEEEVVDAVAELFLNPNYTIPLIGCFRPIVQKIVDKAVALLGQHNLTYSSDDAAAEPAHLVGADVVYVIEHYVRSERGLNLHELSCLAFCRALDLDHSLLESVLTYFKFAPPPFERILREGTASELPKDLTLHLLVVRISYRLLLVEPEFFSKHWNWSCFLDLVNKCVDLDLGYGVEHEKEIADIRWCGIQIMSVILRMSDRTVENFGVGAEEAASCLWRWEEFCLDVAVENFGSYSNLPERTSSSSIGGRIEFNQQNCLKSFELDSLTSSQFCEIGPAAKSRRLVTRNNQPDGNPFIMTSTVKKSFEMVVLALGQRWPVLLYGPAGVGKTALISKMARDTGNQVLSIHMDDQIDGKTLIGSYVCTEQPGQFRWQPGSLIQAVLNGYWVVFEDIDKAPSDVQSILLPLLEGTSSFVTGHGEEIRVADSFRLFSTISTSKIDISQNTEGGNVLSILWRRVMIGLPNNDDLQNIVTAWYPNLEPLAENLIETLEKVNSVSLHHFGRFQSGNSASFSSLSRFSLRDLLKWCKRIEGLGFCSLGGALTAYQCHCVYQEAVDIFAASSASAENRLTIMKEIAKLWGISVPEGGSPQPDRPEIQSFLTELRVGRVTLQHIETKLHGQERLVKMRSSLHVLERIACSVKYNEPVLLVGETGTGKTTLVQNLAAMLGQKLTVLNLSQQSDVADLLGGFKPMDPQSICMTLYKEFESLFSKTFSVKENDKLFAHLQKQLRNKNWKSLLSGFKKCVDNFQKRLHLERSGSGKKRKKPLDEQEKLKAWEKFTVKLETAHQQIVDSSGMIFSFAEGAFVTSLRKGEWILLDEVNLAPAETLQRLVGVLEGEHGSICLAERGDVSHVPRHPRFRIFACMNPATDAGKRDLPCALRSRFTEYFVDDVLDREDMKLFINKFMEESRSNNELEKRIIDFYEAAKKNSEERLQDGANQKPQYSLRSLYRALEFTREGKGIFGFQKAMYDGFCMFFLTLLDIPSAKIMKKMIKDMLLGGKKLSKIPFNAYLKITKDCNSDDFLENYVLTKSVQKQLENLARAVFIKRYPVLLQGPTSSGKTSLVQYLAARTGHEFVRINNHEHTDLQEYLGSYISDVHGKLVFHEGVLVKAVRNGYWIVLDELNLAPSDVLEALNRLLDDNRELFVPELRETVRAHPNFMLFATQNPPTLYGGRKMLSRAFRNRFVEVHVDEIPDYELSTIIEKRCKIPESRAKVMVDVMKELQLHRQSSKVFAGKHGFITPRDLFRWANRLRVFGVSKEVMAEHGYYLLADRLRDEAERHLVQEVLEKHLRVKIVKDDLYKDSVGKETQNFGGVILTKSMRRLYSLVKLCFELREPVLLVGETGGGKTTVCQLLSSRLGSKLHILNCHQYTETSDFLGGFYPIRERSRLTAEFKHIIGGLMLSKAYINFPENLELSSDISQAASTLGHLDAMVTSYREGRVLSPAVTEQDVGTLEQMRLDLTRLYERWQMIFSWQDGPLLVAMKAGNLFLIDEISLADDSVLERLNSVLEPERKLSLAEKGGSVMERITAHENFFVLATMNPGGDYGKKELSPALRNRFTEIWVPSVSDLDELRDIAAKRISDPALSYIVDAMLNFWDWFNQLQTGRVLTVRDLLSWVEFISVTKGSLGPHNAVVHGLFLVLLDGLSLGTGITRKDAELLREKCLFYLLKQLKLDETTLYDLSIIQNYGWGDLGKSTDISCNEDMECDNVFGINPFYIKKGYGICEAGGFEFLAPTTRRNALRVLRAMQLRKPVLLEGSPGVGKTSLIIALGKYSGHKVVRINLSEQTDLMDLLGSDLPVESDGGMKFAWSDGILLQALKEGCWVLLDELNLAPQSVLEGLNAILDHRAEVFIPELGLTFKCPPSFRVFACQNPFSQGGGRKGLPRSFLNRFTKVYIDELFEDDYLFICGSLYPSIPRPILSKLILFNKRLYEDTMLYHKFAQDGSPWEFNLRDVIRSCEIIQGAPEKFKIDCFLNSVYVQRMRTASDRREVLRLYEEIFGVKPFINPYPRVQLNPEYLIVGNSSVKRNYCQLSKPPSSRINVMPGYRHSLEAVVQCAQHNWLCILVGPPSSGKTSLIRLLAQLTGNVLNELNLSSGTDISELLGCFEQYNAFLSFRLLVAQVERYVNEYCSLQLSKVALTDARKKLVTKWLAFSSSVHSSFRLSPTSMYPENWASIFNSLPLLVEIVEQLQVDVADSGVPVSWSIKELNKAMRTVSKLQEDQQNRSFSAKFEWVTGLLIKAIENGEWVVLENSNLCNPTVLDRINSLVESNGSITVNECGIVDGSPVVLHPHPNFRIFLTVNPSYGEVSRAMRNRGVEIFMMQPYWLLDKESGYNFADFELMDVQRFLILSGIPVGQVVDSMARSHVYAKQEGVRVNVQITNFELARWIQLFQQLLINGNQPLWSLQISWEHTYLSSLGEVVGWDIINHAKVAYLSVTECTLPVSLSLGSTEAWPMPLKLRDFIMYSKETSVKQNCMYLECLAAQFELAVSRRRESTSQVFSGSSNGRPYLMRDNIFPKAFNWMISSSGNNTQVDLKLAMKMLWYAANWIIEQATKNDYKLYLRRFGWFSSKLQCFSQFFTSFMSLLEQEVEHPIWKCIFHCHHELASHHQINLKLLPIPLLSFDLVDIATSNETSKRICERHCNAINCVGLLRLSYQQWSAQSRHNYVSEAQHFKPVLESLQELEREVLDLLVDSPSFVVLIKLYNDLLEDHMTFWDAFSSSCFEQSLISWRSLIKRVSKLRDFCPNAVENLLMMERRNLKKAFYQYSEQSLLWTHGGHPILPASAKLYIQQHQLFELCELIWPSKTGSFKQVNKSLVEVVASSSSELRSLALQGICMSSHIISEHDEDNSLVVQQLEEMRQMLFERFGYQRCNLEAMLEADELAIMERNSAGCCAFSTEILCTKSGFFSWQETVPIIDRTSIFLDMELLQKLSSIVLVDPRILQLAFCNVSNLLDSALRFSITFSTRPPQNFIPHQKLLWTLDAWTSVDGVNSKITSYILEIWFWWHSSLWSHPPVFIKNFTKFDGCDFPLPHVLLLPLQTASVLQIMNSNCAVKDYSVHSLKLIVASRNLWETSPLGTNVDTFLLSVARSLLQQIIYAYKKVFDADKFAAIKSTFGSFQKEIITEGDIQHLRLLILSSSHERLNSSLRLFIEPVLRALYLQSTEFHSSIGYAWLGIGGLRFLLLLDSDDLDPALKYSCKYSQIEEKISSLELEIKVRQECDYLAGSLSSKGADKKKAEVLEKLKTKHQRLRRKIVFRNNTSKFNALKKECNEFLKFVLTVVNMVSNFEVMELQQVRDQVLNWQETAASFIDRFSDEYKEYIDVAQPVQVAVYEMKLGLSLIVSSALWKNFLTRVEKDNTAQVMESIYSFMKFPREYALQSISSHGIDMPTKFWEFEISTLEKLLSISSDVSSENGVSLLQLKASLRQNILVRVAHFVADSQRIDKTSFQILDKTFDGFVSMWMNMKVQAKRKEDYAAQQYKFRPRAFKIKNILDVDVSSLGKLFAHESFSEWQELLSEEEPLEKMESGVDNSLEEEWDHILEPVLNNVIHVHNQLFGSADLVRSRGNFAISDSDRLLSFANSYKLGTEMIKGFGGLLFTNLDAKLVPEHLLCLCLEHELKFVPAKKSSKNYNFYKDSNAPVMAKMVKLLTSLQRQICSLLSQWEDHPGLLKIMDVIEMLLAIPVDTPIAKSLSGLQFLLNRTTVLQEYGSKFSLSDQLDPIIALVCSWQKMEFDSWPALLDEVQDQHEVNAAKLWFPLYSVLHHSDSADMAGYKQSTIESLEEFVQTSSIGEFRKRLQLLFAFHGQISTARCLEVKTYLSPMQESNLEILYNVFGYYVQFLPRILEHVEGNRRQIEGEVKELLKLCRWERTEACLSIENSKRTRQKLKKLIQKYTDFLQQPVMLMLNQEAQQKGNKNQSLQGLKPLNDILAKDAVISKADLDLKEFNNKYRSIWFSVWRNKVSKTLQTLHLDSTSEISVDNKELDIIRADVAKILQQCLEPRTACLSNLEQWGLVCETLEKIYRTTIDCNDLWKDTTKGVGKKRAFSELLKLLETSGLHKHKFEIIKLSNDSKWLFVQPSYDAEHLLPVGSRLSYIVSNVSTASELQRLPGESLTSEWKAVNEFYFKSMASVQLLQRICLKPHEDITYELASRSVSFLNHLIVIQQTQRAAAYGYGKQLNQLRECVSLLDNLYSKCTGISNRTSTECLIAQNQCAIYECMLKQKQLFDSLCTMLVEESLLLKTVDSAHLKSCPSVKPAARDAFQLMEKFFPVMQNAKESLDKYLLGRVGSISAGAFHLNVVSKQMEQLVHQNFQVIKEFEGHLLDFLKQDPNRSSVIKALFGHFDDVLNKAKWLAEQLESAMKVGKESTYTSKECSELEAGFSGAVKKISELIKAVLTNQCSLKNACALTEESLENINSWEHLFKSSVANLKVEEMSENLVKTISSAEKLVNHGVSELSSHSHHIGACFEYLHALLDIILDFGDGILQDLLSFHKTVSMVTYALANVLASLFSEGFRIPAKDQVDDSGHDISQDASGTGMGEGSGLNDVSDQITDEDQLLGASEKLGEEQDASGEVPDKNQKGIEMDQDFAADTFSVSEDSGEENDEDGEDEQLESAMGEAGDKSEVVDEKLWDKEDDENPNNTDEKYESGPSVRDRDESSRELRAKEDSTAVEDDESLLPDSEDLDKRTDEVGNQDDLGTEEEDMDDMDMDKKDAFADPTGLKIDETNQNPDEMDVDEDVDEKEGSDVEEETGPEDADTEKTDMTSDYVDPADKIVEEPDTEKTDITSDKNDQGKDAEENLDTNSMAQKKDVSGPGIVDLNTDCVPSTESATQPTADPQALDSRNVAPEANISNTGETNKDLAPLRSLPSANTTDMEILVSDSSNTGILTDESKAQLPQRDPSSVQRSQPNPYRNVGDALKDWKERVKVSVDLQSDNKEALEEAEQNDADDYGYVPEFEKGTAQALGPATSEQIEANVNGNKPDEDNHAAERDDITVTESEKQSAEEWHLKHSTSILKNKMEEQMHITNFEKSQKEGPTDVRNLDELRNVSENLVSIKKSFASEDIYQFSKLSVDDHELGKVQDPEEVSLDIKNNAAALWRRYELHTTRLSQELAEQLRLIMEPTLASKLQGDYKTGKRINMKKVIPYIASHYRKDKIWLRRTRPNKRDYQVVIAVDDSRSMSESNCGDVAVEALVTICRAMSQLEMGNMAVASFGKKGNIRLLHDFDQPFTGEAGVKIISNLTFSQENTIVDEPVVDLLKYLSNTLDAAVAKARLPTGHNPLQQLVVIIADGRFHEKERLKRCVRDFLSRNRMVAFLLVDSPQESIINHQEASFVGQGDKRVLKFTKYLESFPFPHYVILTNIEELPRRLADLLRQWFELMQNSRD